MAPRPDWGSPAPHWNRRFSRSTSTRIASRPDRGLENSLLLSPRPLPAFLLVEPISNVEGTSLQLDPLRFAVGQKCHSVLVHERQVPQIEDQRLPARLGDEQ